MIGSSRGDRRRSNTQARARWCGSTAPSLGWLHLIGGAVGFAASFGSMIEKIAKLGNPDYVPTCSLNPVVSYGSVMESPQAEAFGFRIR